MASVMACVKQDKPWSEPVITQSTVDDMRQWVNETPIVCLPLFKVIAADAIQLNDQNYGIDYVFLLIIHRNMEMPPFENPFSHSEYILPQNILWRYLNQSFK